MPHLRRFHPSNNFNPNSYKKFTSKQFPLVRKTVLVISFAVPTEFRFINASIYPPASPAATDISHLRRLDPSNNFSPSSFKEFTSKPFPRVCKRCLLSPLPFLGNSDLSMCPFIRRLHRRLPIGRTYGA